MTLEKGKNYIIKKTDRWSSNQPFKVSCLEDYKTCYELKRIPINNPIAYSSADMSAINIESKVFLVEKSDFGLFGDYKLLEQL
jgi:hypothetical protein